MEVLEILECEYNKSYQHKTQWKTAINNFKALSQNQQRLAAEGIMRHIEASENCDLHFDYSAVCEIIMDAKNNRQIWKESDAAFLKEIAVEDEKEFQARLKLPSFAQTA